jgi:hypothetical protein
VTKLFFYLVLNRAQANLAMARRDLRMIEQQFYADSTPSPGRPVPGQRDSQAFFRPTPVTADRRRRRRGAPPAPVSVRDDGLAAVIRPARRVLRDRPGRLVEVDSGMVLDAWVRGGPGEVAGGDAGRSAPDTRTSCGRCSPSPGRPPVSWSSPSGHRHHLVRCVADPAGGRLALAVVVVGPSRVVRRTRRHLRQLPDASLTAGPWILSLGHEGPPVEVPVPASMGVPPEPAAAFPQVPAQLRGPAPPSALPPARRADDR